MRRKLSPRRSVTRVQLKRLRFQVAELSGENMTDAIAEGPVAGPGECSLFRQRVGGRGVISVGASGSLVMDGGVAIRLSSCSGVHRQCQSGRGDDQIGRGRETFGRDVEHIVRAVSRIQDQGLVPGVPSATMEFDLTRLDSNDDSLVPPSSATEGAVPPLPTWVDSPPEQTTRGVNARNVARRALPAPPGRGPSKNLVQDRLHTMAGIQLHQGKTRVWNREGTCPADFEDFGEEVWSPRGVKILGTPIGSHEFVQSLGVERLLEEQRLWEAVSWVRDLQCALQILLQCAGPRCHHHVRTHPASPSSTRKATIEA